MTSAIDRNGFKVALFRTALPPLLLLAFGALLQCPACAQDNPADNPTATSESGQSGPEGPAGPAGSRRDAGKATCRPSKWYYRCCGSREYDPFKDACCGGVLIAGRPFGACCGRAAFDADIQGCCNGRVVNRPAASPGSSRGALACCGTEGYDPNVYYCCGGKVVERSPVTSCCGGQPYFSPEPIGPTVPGLPSTPPPAKVCCGCRLYSTTGYRGQPSCCGDVPYDLATQLCCNGALHNIVGIDSPSCCGTALVDPGSNTGCCQGRPFHYGSFGPLCCPDGTLNSCCYLPDRNTTECI